MGSVNNEVQAVRFGENTDAGFVEHNRKYNFIYSLVHREDSQHLTTSMDGYCIPIAAGVTVRKMYRMDDDYNFLLWNCQYAALYLDPRAQTWESYENFVPVNTLALESSDLQTIKGTPYERYLRITLSIHSPTGKYLYGGPDFSYTRAGLMSPLYVLTMQGNAEGYGQIKTSYLVPKKGIIQMEISNVHATKDLKVSGYLYGEKVRV